MRLLMPSYDDFILFEEYLIDSNPHSLQTFIMTFISQQL